MTSEVTRPCWRRKVLGSSIAGTAPVNVMSNARPHSLGSQITRSRISPSRISTRSGPTDVSKRLLPSSRDARTTWCWSPTDTDTNASVTPRFGYCPSPVMRKSSSLLGWQLK